MESFLQKPLPQTTTELQAEYDLIDAWQKDCENAIRELMAQEDMDRNISFAHEIHELHQQKNMLATHKEFRRVRMARLRFEQGGRI